jgi:poly(beta-D-mannuronate) lyase
MKSVLRSVAFWSALALAGAGVANAAEAPLRSPWDLHPVPLTDVTFACTAAPELPRDFQTNSYYTDSHHSIIDPALKKKYDDSVAAIVEFSRAVVKSADTFQTTGSRSAAQCVASLLESVAKRRVLAGTMDGHQAYYVQGWNLGAWAVAYLKVRGSGLISGEQEKIITKWMKELALDNRDYYDTQRRRSRPNDGYNNHLYWAGFAISASAIANNDRGLFRWAVNAYKDGIHEIADDGTLPLEMERAQRALHYHLYALAPLMMLAEFGETNGVDLYAERDYAIKRLVARCLGGLEDPSFFQQRTGVQQVTTEVEAWEISWAQFYTRRFPDPKASALLAKAPHLDYTMLGGLPPQ